MQKNNEISKIESSSAYNNLDNGYKPNIIHKSRNAIPSTKYNKDNSAACQANTNAKRTSKIFTSFVALVSAVLAGIGGLSILVNFTNAKATIESVFCEETAIYCFINIEQYEEGLTVELYNDFTNRIEKIENVEKTEFYFENLKPYMHYTLSIKKDSTILDSKVVYTKFSDSYYEKENYRQPEFEDNDIYDQQDDEYDKDNPDEMIDEDDDIFDDSQPSSQDDEDDPILSDDENDQLTDGE